MALPLLALAACANPGTPMGGPKDEKPPVIKRSTPAPNALGYKKKEVTIEFDELIQLKDVNQKLVVSPPLNKQPSVVARGNSLVIVMDEDLQDNTTYTFDFADAVADNNEGNVLPNFRFSFSTGQVVDSLSISGNLFQATDLAPIGGALVFIHSNLTDTAFQTLVPVRLAKTDDKGRFSIRNVSPGTYKLYALEDANRNYKYDQPGERIAWLDSLVVPTFGYREVTDSIAPDSSVTRQELVYLPDSLKLFMFAEDQYVQYRTGDARKERARIDLTFNRRVEEFSAKPIDEEVKPGWALWEQSASGDSLSIWLTQKEMYQKDTLRFEINYTALDSLKKPFIKKDTLSFFFFEVAEKKRKRDSDKEEVPSLSFGELKPTLDFFGSLSFSMSTAPVEINRLGLKVYELVDSVKTEVPFSFVHDSLYIRRFRINADWNAGGNYQLAIDSASFRDVYGIVNKNVTHKFNIRNLDSYGTVYATIADPQPNWLLQMIDSKEQVVRQALVPSRGKLAFRYLMPAEYMFRIVVDANGNGIWDTGNLAKGAQPETLYYYHDKVAVRANWEHEVSFNPHEFDIYKFTEKFRKSQKQAGGGRR